YALFCLITTLIMYSSQRYWQDYAIDVTKFYLELIFAYFFVTRLAKQNILVYVLTGFVTSIGLILPEILKHSPRTLYGEAIASCVLLLLPVLYTVILFARGDKPLLEPEPDAEGDTAIET
ncbi:MAG: hypothetical protein ACRD3W_07730, partial [Terriglobales bacterium]